MVLPLDLLGAADPITLDDDPLSQLVLEYCDMGAVDSILAELDHGFDEEAIRIVTKQTLMVSISWIFNVEL